MPAPYSQDLRRRVINAYYNKEGSQRQIAARFHQGKRKFCRKNYQLEGSMIECKNNTNLFVLINEPYSTFQVATFSPYNYIAQRPLVSPLSFELSGFGRDDV